MLAAMWRPCRGAVHMGRAYGLVQHPSTMPSRIPPGVSDALTPPPPPPPLEAGQTLCLPGCWLEVWGYLSEAGTNNVTWSGSGTDQSPWHPAWQTRRQYRLSIKGQWRTRCDQAKTKQKSNCRITWSQFIPLATGPSSKKYYKFTLKCYDYQDIALFSLIMSYYTFFLDLISLRFLEVLPENSHHPLPLTRKPSN